jgi:hypothetical protein
MGVVLRTVIENRNHLSLAPRFSEVERAFGRDLRSRFNGFG